MSARGEYECLYCQRDVWREDEGTAAERWVHQQVEMTVEGPRRCYCPLWAQKPRVVSRYKSRGKETDRA